ncbi:hypothetical protein BJ322DRAFT_1000862, partial [Thelephora terrestris]
SSTHNTRIERLWVEVGRNFCRSWRAFFGHLEDQFGLDCSRPSHIWLLQTLFLEDINADCDSFVREWNLHPISGHDTNDMSPQDLRFIRQTQLGVYNEDDCEGVHPETIQEYYGTTEDHVQRLAGQTGAGHPPEELDDDYADINLINNVIQDQDLDIQHDSIPTADHEVPRMSPELLALFSDGLVALQDNDLLRSLAGDDFVWDLAEVIRVGHRRQKELVISLVNATWERRALLWLATTRVFDSIL